MKAPRGRVLVVEDEAYVSRSLVEILQERRFDVAEASGVAEACGPRAETPIVILTGHGDVSTAVTCLKAGANALAMAEELALPHLEGNRRAVHGDERSVAASAELVEMTGQDLLGVDPRNLAYYLRKHDILADDAPSPNAT